MINQEKTIESLKQQMGDNPIVAAEVQNLLLIRKHMVKQRQQAENSVPVDQP